MRVDLCLNPKQFSPAEIRERIPALCALLQKYDVRAAYVFGSALQSQGSRLSDLDLAVVPPPDLRDYLGYYNDVYGDLCQLFQADNIDLVLLNQAPLALQACVVVEGLCILNGERAELEESVLARHLDLAGWRQENWDVTRDLIRRGAIGEMNMIEKSRVERFIFLVRDAVRELRTLNLENMGLESYQADKHTRALSEHYMRIALEAILDLGRHVIVKTALGVPQEYREVGRILREKGVVPTELGKKLETLAGLRNVLVHLYWDVDYALLYRVIVGECEVFERCIEHILSYVDNLERDSSR